MDYTLTLPPEILLDIFSFLDGEQLFTCLGVCKRWREILNKDAIWKKFCLKGRIADPVAHHPPGEGIEETFPLTPWAEAFYLYRCVPLKNWRDGNSSCMSIHLEEPDYFCDAWNGHYVAIYYYTIGKVYIFSVYGTIKVHQVMDIPLPTKENIASAAIALNESFMVLARSNIAMIFKRNFHGKYTAIRSFSITDGKFCPGFDLSNRNAKICIEIAWGNVWLGAVTLSDTHIINLSDFTWKTLPGKPYLAFNDEVDLIIAWKKFNALVVTTAGEILFTLESGTVGAIKSLDFNNKYLVLRIDNSLRIHSIKNGKSLTCILINDKLEYRLLSNNLILLQGNKISSLSSFSLETRCYRWYLQGLQGKASDLRFIGPKYIFIVPSYSKERYCLVENKGHRFHIVREGKLPEGYNLYPSPVFTETLSFFVVRNENRYDLISFM